MCTFRKQSAKIEEQSQELQKQAAKIEDLSQELAQLQVKFSQMEDPRQTTEEVHILTERVHLYSPERRPHDTGGTCDSEILSKLLLPRVHTCNTNGERVSNCCV